MIVVRTPGPLTTVQDAGRPGWAHLGVPRAGAVDAGALRAANRLVGNTPAAAGLETTLVGPDLVFERAAVVAVTGGRCVVTVDDEPVAFGEPVAVPAGGVLRLGEVRTGVRSCLAVRGGLDVRLVLGSRSTCTLSGLGPERLAAGDRLAIGSEVAGAVTWEVLPEIAAVPVLRVRLGPRDDAFTAAAVERLLSSSYVVQPQSDRTGVRLSGPRLERRDAAELPSEGMLPGVVQVPPDGQPIVFLANCPTTGGYPVIGVVAIEDLAAAAQARPGTAVRFRRQLAE